MAVERSFPFVALLFALILAACGLDVAGPNRPPQALLLVQAQTSPDLPALLDGGRSFDPDGDGLSYRWSLLQAPPGAGGAFGPEQGSRTTFTPDGPGIYVISLVVSDGRLDSEAAVARIRALKACTQDGDCDDSDPCTIDTCQQGECHHEPVADCGDLCPDDPDKTEPGLCGCGVPDVDGDGDAVPDCLDLCPEDPDKTEPGLCGCGVPDVDGDGDEVPDCLDGCPQDPDKSEPGLCGCGVPDVDSDGDAVPDCLDGCPQDPDKTEPGLCGCGAEELDSDGDGFCDSDDCAPFNARIHPGATELCNGIDDNCDGQRDETGCPCEAREFRDHVYLFCAGGANWTAARNACRAQGYELATVDDAQENEALHEMIVGLLGDVSAWHGFNDRADEDEWLWSSGGGTGYTNWASDQPDNSWGEDCGQFWSGRNGRWNDADCGDSHAYVCESACGAGFDHDGDGWGDACDCAPLNPWIHPDATEVCNGKDDDCDGQIDGIEDCPCATVSLGGHVYSFCAESLDWQTARQRCQAYGGDLVSVDSDAEQTAVRNGVGYYLSGSEVWIGYNDLAEEGTFAWSNGSPVGYENWNDGEPNDANDNEDCVHFRDDGRWNDANCADAKAFVCEAVPCEHDLFMDIDGDGVCGDLDTCPVTYNPEQAGACGDTSCFDLMQNAGRVEDGLYWINPAGVNLPLKVYCDMHRAGGGWTMVAIYGTDGRPGRWSVAAYPRPGAALYGSMSEAVMDAARNDNFIGNASVPAGLLWGAAQGEVLAWVGGVTDDYVTASLPAGCNYFSASDLCFEDNHGPFSVFDSAGTVVSSQAYACTTAHAMAGFEEDPFDEFGLHLLDGLDNSPDYNCHQTATESGFQGWGRLFTTFEASNGAFWNGVHSYWDPNGAHDQPGALFIR